ncbi:hypothetical protein FW778_12395 [Ginsengibacter hankyongi]|uniref:Activator of Hsp90 ATPase homologue 1/2-like C-terminal domain-containing protein n=1 Tax=Ginsengibacter hankyongi TaxID=2607284 RepID=A0A5J5IGP8_9BACT|nr:SRPBCC family protein [Ginsengibacter hankyongi]KAA9038366.1 hypothetical protein FW778_12395 [Ginsengibacter hankyongi]
MKNKDYKKANYSVAIEFAESPNDVFNHVINLSKWWPEEFEGESIKLNTEFIFKTGDGHYSKNKVVEFVPNKKIVWLTIESIRKTDNFDRTGTKMIFELTPNGSNTLLKFTYDGVVLEDESDRLVEICDFVIKEKLYNLIESFTATIEVAKTPQDVFNCINDVTKWWSKDFEGNSTKLNDEFIINHPKQHYSKQKLVEVIPGKKVVWLVTESKLDWLKNNTEEWTNTKMIFEISASGDKTVLDFTHEGLTPEKECYAMCEKGWSIIIKDWLFHFITVGTPSKEMAKAAEVRNQLLENKTKMEKKDFHRAITVNASTEEAMKKISQINLWWRKDFLGNAEKLNDKFTVPFGEPSFVDFIISEFVPGKKVVWKVTDCYLPWFQDKKEWNNTEVVFQLSEENDTTKIDFTHIGLVPEVECYEVCEKGWNGHIDTLVKFINE